MKISIEIDLQPDEISMATEICDILRQITAHVKAKNTPQLFKALIMRLEDTKQLESVSTDVCNLLQEAGQESFVDLYESFVTIAFDPELVSRNQSVAPYFLLLPRLPDLYKTLMRDKLIPEVITFLTQKRPLESNRLEFFTYAEAFAVLVKLEFVNITGAVATLNTLLQKPDTKCAAITMLGKTVELCLDLLKEKCDPSALQALGQSLHIHATEEVFRYDVNYINDHMGWKLPPKNSNPKEAPKPSGPAAPSDGTHSSMTPAMHNQPEGLSLIATDSFSGGHTATIFAICYDDVRDEVISTGKDGVIVAWSNDGQQRQKQTLKRHYSCSMDINPVQRSLFLCGVPKVQTSSPAIIGYDLKKAQWNLKGSCERPDVKLVSCVKALVHDQNNVFVTGESSKLPMEREKVRVYDANVGSFDRLSPIVSYEEHDDIITSLTHLEGIFFSGSRDCTVRIWDKRQPGSVATLGSYSNGRVVAHDGMVTCLDAYSYTLVSAGLDKKVAVWDLRSADRAPMARLTIDGCAILKVAIGPHSTSAAVSSLKNLYMVDFMTGQSTVVTPFSDKRSMKRYNDLKWNNDRTVLYGGGDDMRVDQFTIAEI